MAVIDATDAHLVEGWNWCAMPTEGYKWYAYSSGLNKRRLHQHLMPAPQGLVTDHINRDGLDNRRSNLRFATPLENSRNRSAYGKSVFKGVSPNGNKWRARITTPSGRLHLGSYDTEEAAASAYDAAAKEHFGKFAVLNYDPRQDLTRGIEACYSEILNRVAAGGPPWIPPGSK